MQFHPGNAYDLYVVEDARISLPLQIRGPGLLLVQSGIIAVDDKKVMTHEGAELFGTHTVEGHGTFAWVQCLMTPPSDRPADLRFTQRTEKPWGYELSVHTTEKLNLLKLLSVRVGHRTSEHFHRMKEETMVFIDGTGREAMHVLPMTVHRVAGPHTYFEGSTYHPDDVVRISDDYHRNDGCC
jgi:hypothetical protein